MFFMLNPWNLSCSYMLKCQQLLNVLIFISSINEPRREITGPVYAKLKTQISFSVTAKLISAFVFAT